MLEDQLQSLSMWRQKAEVPVGLQVQHAHPRVHRPDLLRRGHAAIPRRSMLYLLVVRILRLHLISSGRDDFGVVSGIEDL